MTRRFVAQRFHHSSRRATEMFRHYCWYSDRSFKTEELRRRSEVKEEICAYASWCILANLQRHTLFSYTNTACTSLSLSLSASHLFTHKHCLCVTANTLSSIALSDWLSQRSENPHNGGTVVVIYDSDSEERTRCADVQSAMTDLPNIRLTYLCCLLRVPSGEGTLCLPGFKIKTPPPSPPSFIHSTLYLPPALFPFSAFILYTKYFVFLCIF